MLHDIIRRTVHLTIDHWTMMVHVTKFIDEAERWISMYRLSGSHLIKVVVLQRSVGSHTYQLSLITRIQVQVVDFLDLDVPLVWLDEWIEVDAFL